MIVALYREGKVDDVMKRNLRIIGDEKSV